MKKIILFGLLIVSFNCACYCQNESYYESLKAQLNTKIHDTLRTRIYLDLAEYFNNEKDWMPYNSKALKMSNTHIKRARGGEKIFYLKAKANSLGNLGFYYDNHGDITKSITYYFESLKYFDLANDQVGKASILGNLGVLFTDRQDYVEAIDYLNQALIIKLKYDPKQVSKNYLNIGAATEGLGDSKKALTFYFKALNSAEKVGNKIDMSIAVNNIGSWYHKYKNYSLAKPYLKKAIDLSLEDDEAGAAWAMANLASCYFAESNLDSTFYFILKAKEISDKYDYAELKMMIAEKSYMYYLCIKDFENALLQFTLAEKTKDQIENIESQKTALRQKMNYDNNLKQTAAKLKREEEQKREAQIFYFILSGLFLSAIFATLIYNRLRITKKQKRVIEIQKQSVEEQKIIIEGKNNEILDSINYAKRVQEAILPSFDNFKNSFADYFILYLPKDIVAGDFYWYYQTEKFIFFAVADCTGHGVPGALVSVVCANALERTINESINEQTGPILDKVTKYIIESFEKEGSDVKDGMDIAFCRLDKNDFTLSYSGAYNPCVIKRGNELIELKADRRPVGKHIDDSIFETQIINCQKEDWIYLFSDGFQDQFGGQNGKKYKSSNFKKLLLKNSTRSGKTQEILFNKEIYDWRGELPQIDDICILGVQL